MPPNKLYPNKVYSSTLRAVRRLPAFFISFSMLAHSPKRQPCMAWLTVFREKSRWKPAQAYCKQAHNTLAFPARMECSLKDEREQALFPCFPTCKSSSLCSPPAGTIVFIISIGKGSYVFFTTSQGQAVPVRRKNLPCDIRCEVFFARNLANSKHYPLKPM